MKIPSSQPLKFSTGDLLGPSDLNDVFGGAARALDAAASRRWMHGVLVLQLTGGVATPYTQATAAAVRTFRFVCPNTCIVERAIFRANMTSTAAVEVSITSAASLGGASTGVAPAGATTPWLSTAGATMLGTDLLQSECTGPVASALSLVSDTAPDRVLLVAGTEYIIALTSTGNFTLGRFDLELHTLTDRFQPAGTLIAPSYARTIFTDANAPDATLVAANAAALTTEVAKLSNLIAPTPILFQVHDLTSGTDADLRTFTLPRLNSFRAQGRIVRMYLRVEMAAAGAVGQTITAVLQSAGGGPLRTLTANVNGVTGASVDSGAISTALVASSVSAETTTDDYSVVFANSAAGAASKVTALLWVSR
jgi:hypothetical protein